MDDQVVQKAPLALSYRVIPLGDIHPDPSQPRTKRDEAADKELAASMRTCLLQPIVVWEKDGKYLIINGERRWRAAGTLEWADIPCMVATGDIQAAVLQLIGDIQREDLCQDDLARHLGLLAEQFKQEDRKATVRALAALVNKSIGWVSEKITLSQLPNNVQALKDGRTVRNSRVLIGLARLHEQNPDAAAALIHDIEAGKPVTTEEISKLRGTNRKPREGGESKPEAAFQATAAPAGTHGPGEATGSGRSMPAATPAAAANVAADHPAATRPARRKKVVADAAKLVGISDEMPAEELIEALASVILQLKGVAVPGG